MSIASPVLASNVDPMIFIIYELNKKSKIIKKRVIFAQSM